MWNRREDLAEGVTLYCGDCREIIPGLGPIDAVVTDPPYGLGVDYASFDDTIENVLSLARDWVPACIDLAKRVAFTPGVNRMRLYPEPEWIIAWIMEAGGGYSSWGFNMWQPILCYGKDAYLANGQGARPDTIITNEVGRMDEYDHPCPKPIGVWTRIVQRFSLPGESVLDPFMGSGTGAVSCIKLGRSFVGIEIEPTYFDLACRRAEDALARPDLFVRTPVARSKTLPLFGAGR